MIIGLMYTNGVLKYSEVAEGRQTLLNKLKAAGWTYSREDEVWYFGEFVKGFSVPHTLITAPLGWSGQ